MTICTRVALWALLSIAAPQVHATSGPGSDVHSVGLQIWNANGGSPVKDVFIGYENTGYLVGDLYYEFSDTSFTVLDTFVPWCGIIDCSGLPVHLAITRLDFPGVTGVTFSSSLPDMVETHTANSITFTWKDNGLATRDVFLSAHWINAIPEPSTFALTAAGLLLFVAVSILRSTRRSAPLLREPK